ncbi:HlyD family efflux transporter periplasmic adaptor subunit [Pseudomonas sp. LPB0260]|nr:HlyD family efflux transporter periplasmic adaptor subunit [Pseudomonas sp. LPB0260]QLC77657.1 HlyD family efflux transporter periplasmic adaptor subunit [Pseudomonas sp. LPB0260]
MAHNGSRIWISLGLGALLAAALAYAFWPLALPVDLGTAQRAPMQLSIDEEGRTRVRERYVLSAPFAGRLLRVEVEPGDRVEGGRSVVARMLPSHPPPLDRRDREQARAQLDASTAAQRAAAAELAGADAERRLADRELQRARRLHARDALAQAELERSQRSARTAAATRQRAEAAVARAEAEQASARARLGQVAPDAEEAGATAANGDAVPLLAPVSGQILRLLQESATSLADGAPILEIGDVDNDLEVLVELLSSDAVRVAPGNPVIIDNWGGPDPLHGEVERVEPAGFTKFSALGVEEQRVNTLIRLSDPPARRAGLGHGYRVLARIVVWQSAETLSVPSSALFREDGDWALFVVENGRARLVQVEVGANNGRQAQLLGGLDAGAQVILYPGAELSDGVRVQPRQLAPAR